MRKNVIIPLLAVLLLTAACSAKGGYQEAPSFKSAAESMPQAEVLRGREAADFAGEPEDQQAAALPAMERKLIKRAELRVRVEDPAEADKAVTALMEQHGAYAASTEISDNSRYYVIRVPQRNYGAFLAAMDGMGRMLRRSESAEDVTLRYYDLEGRLAAKQELLKTYQSYLGKAKNIEEILSVEARIADLQIEIDQTGKDLRYLANQADYATISLDILGPVAAALYRGPTLSERVKELFGGFGEFASTVLTVLIGIVIYGIPLLLILALLFWLCFGRIGLLKKLWRVVTGKK
jgi:hypothetical protein